MFPDSLYLEMLTLRSPTLTSDHHCISYARSGNGTRPRAPQKSTNKILDSFKMIFMAPQHRHHKARQLIYVFPAYLS